MPDALVTVDHHHEPTMTDSTRDANTVRRGDASTLLLRDQTPPDRSESRFVPGAILGGRYRIVSMLGHGGMGRGLSRGRPQARPGRRPQVPSRGAASRRSRERARLRIATNPFLDSRCKSV